jgi:hypothetical protein
MSVDVKDFRKYTDGKLAESIKAAEEKVAQKPLLEQAESTLAATGHPELDKLLRSIQELVNQAEAGKLQVAASAMDIVPEEGLRVRQFEYFFLKGMLQAYKNVSEMPARIIAESKSIAV